MAYKAWETPAVRDVCQLEMTTSESIPALADDGIIVLCSSDGQAARFISKMACVLICQLLTKLCQLILFVVDGIHVGATGFVRRFDNRPQGIRL